MSYVDNNIEENYEVSEDGYVTLKHGLVGFNHYIQIETKTLQKVEEALVSRVIREKISFNYDEQRKMFEVTDGPVEFKWNGNYRTEYIQGEVSDDGFLAPEDNEAIVHITGVQWRRKTTPVEPQETEA